MNVQFARNRTRLRCEKCGAEGEIACDCGPQYIREANATSKADQAAEALRDPANVKKSDRALAKELGVSDKTVGAARKATAEFSAVGERRVGRDGKARKAPSRPPARAPGEKQHQASVNTFGPDWEAFKAKAEKEGQSAAAKLGAMITREVTGVEIEPATLPKTAHEKLEAAKRQIERKLNAEHAARMAQIDEEVRQRVLRDGKEYRVRLEKIEESARINEKFYRDMIANHKAIFTIDQFKLIVSCLHSDSRASASAERLNEAFVLFNAKKLQLTKAQ